jgi:hypothetical protein
MTMQHDVFVNPGRRFRIAFPFIVELQADVAESKDRLVAPLLPVAGRTGIVDRQAPLVWFDGCA